MVHNILVNILVIRVHIIIMTFLWGCTCGKSIKLVGPPQPSQYISLIGKFRRETNGKRGLLDPFHNGVPLLTQSHVKKCALKFIICTFQLVSGCRFTATQDQAQRMTEMFGEK